MTDIPDQEAFWNDKFEDLDNPLYRIEPSGFAKLTEGFMQVGSKVLELGGGIGADAVYFVAAGHDVVSTDFAATAVAYNQAHLARPGLQFQKLDLVKGFPFNDASFDAVYARLVLHSLAPSVIGQTISEIHRVLKPGGLLAFDCKTPDDHYFGNGEELEPNFFISTTGHARHFFTKPYAQELLVGYLKLPD